MQYLQVSEQFTCTKVKTDAFCLIRLCASGQCVTEAHIQVHNCLPLNPQIVGGFFDPMVKDLDLVTGPKQC